MRRRPHARAAVRRAAALVTAALAACDDGPRGAPRDAGAGGSPDAGFVTNDLGRPADALLPPLDALLPPLDALLPPLDAPRPPGDLGTDAPAPPADASVADAGVAEPAPASFGAGFVDISAPLVARPAYPWNRDRGGADPEANIASFADLDGDGRLELIVSPSLGAGGDAWAQFYRYDRATGSFGAPTAVSAGDQRVGVLGALDLDGDGHDDLLLDASGREIAWGLGGGRFDAPAEVLPFNARRYLVPTVFASDLDGDGWLDLVFGSPTCCATCPTMALAMRTGPRAWADRTDLFPDVSPSSSHAVFAGRFGGETVVMNLGTPCGDVDSPTFYRVGAAGPDGYPRLEVYDPIPADAYVRQQTSELRRAWQISWVVPMGAAIEDIDDDGEADLAVSLDFYPGLFQGRTPGPFPDRTGDLGAQALRAEGGRRMIPWGVALVDVDRDGRDDLVNTHGNDHSAWTDPAWFVGPQWSTVRWNAGGWRFVDVTARVGVGLRGQWRALAVDDLDDDGDVDLAVGGQGEAPRVFRNDIDRGFRGLSLRLRGTTSNPLGAGARVEVVARAGEAPRRYVVGGVGTTLAVSQPRVFAGLGVADRAAVVRVTWPSGYVQELRDVPAGARTIDEPPTLAVLPAGRHLAADGRAQATVRVTPRAPDGTPRGDARVEVVSRFGTAVVGPARRDGDGWVATVTAPATRGSTVVEARVDGVALGVRPRIWWD